MDHLRRADAKISQATHPVRHAKWRLNRWNPKIRWNMKKHKVTHPIDHQKAKVKRRFNHMNPFFYLKRIKNNIKSVFRRK
ncbi:hypothetical protein Mapa_013801 [Marchantia paleacea]|nr:hypothetical protein Mapa_013801 [Marchantia paleacea]